MKKIISMSLYGNDSIYINGSIENAKLIPKIYGTDWEIRFYTQNITSSIKEELEKLNCVVINMDNDEIKNGRFLRFLAIEENNIVLIRDVDSIVSYREKMMVLEFLNSKKKLHIIRDHPNHQEFMMAGMFGFCKSGINMKKIINESKMKNILNYGIDQIFLAKHIYTLFKCDMLIHDNFNKFYNERNEILIKYPRVLNHIGQRIFLDPLLKTEDEKRLEQFKGYINFLKINFESVNEFMNFFINCLKVSKLLKRSLIINNYRIKNEFFDLKDYIILDELMRYTKIQKNQLLNMSEITISSKELETDEIKLSILENLEDVEYDILNIDVNIIVDSKDIDLFTLYNVIQLKDELNYEIEEHIIKNDINLYTTVICHDSNSYKKLESSKDINIIEYKNLYDSIKSNIKKEFFRLFSGIFRIHINPPFIIEKISKRYWNHINNEFLKI